MRKLLKATVLAAVFPVFALPSEAAEISGPGANEHRLLPWARIGEPDLAEPSPEAETNLKRITVPKGFELKLWAAEPMLANPVAFCLDEKGRVFVAETHRYRTSVLDIRHYMFMLEEDLACRTVEDRLRMSSRNFPTDFPDLSVETEVIRLLEDRDGDGRADFSSVYADKFDTALDGIASGVLARKGKVYFTNIPHLWELEGIDEQGHAKSRRSLSHGYGVRFSLTGHDMHGLIIGPDGKLYFSIGDRGSTVITQELKLLAYPDEGCVYRCNLDGSGLEVVHRGLRNPQELAFDDFGNLFTGDNDFDHGDEERLVQIVEGGDSGWRIGYQHAPLGFTWVPWMSEQIWVAHDSRQAEYNGDTVSNPIIDTGVRPAAYLPPVANIENGPSGLSHYPGTGLPAKYNNRFFLCHFKGNIANSKVQSFSVKPRGASFALDASESFSGNMQPTDLEFGPDGSIYFADWGQGWTRTRKGRIYRIIHPEAAAEPIVAETKSLLAAGFETIKSDELLRLLGHRDRRVRQEVHFELAARAPKSIRGLVGVARQDTNRLARVHAIWALGIIGQRRPNAVEGIQDLLSDHDMEVRRQTAKVIGDTNFRRGGGGLLGALKDPEAPVRFQAAMSLGKLRDKKAVPAIVAMLRNQEGPDPYLRHASVMALVGIADFAVLNELARDESPAVRMAALLAMRKLGRAEISTFLHDDDFRLAVEAARAINDAPIEKAMPKLAALLDQLPAVPDPFRDLLHLRAINANFRTGSPESATRLARYAARSDVPPALRAEALFALATWATPHQRDRIVGIYRPLGWRNDRAAASAVTPLLDTLLTAAPEPVCIAAIDAVVRLKIATAQGTLFYVSRDRDAAGTVRAAALNGLAALKSRRLNEALQFALEQSSAEVRETALALTVHLNGNEALRHLEFALDRGSIREKQIALSSLGRLPAGLSDRLLSRWMKKLIAGELPVSLQLDLLEAAELRTNADVRALVNSFNDAGPGDELSTWRPALQGGDPIRGEDIFKNRRDVQCTRCHKLNGSGGDAGPDLTGIAGRHPREYLLESIVDPSAKIAEGFDNVQVTVKGDANFAGVIRRETEDELVLVSNEDGEVVIRKSDILSRQKGLSGMPAGMHLMLGRRDTRDLVEFLARQKP
ncbi:MAG: HEAT repeat domain-containing protein [Verrucomicrobiae bacterium]|nr:HEAT repeat domain-containing protein [Verrucomicrobiae bacterium]